MISELWNGLSMGSILKALQEHNVEAAEKEMYAHIMRSRDDMLTYYK